MTLKRVSGGWVKVRKTSVHHWRFESGDQEWVGVSVIYPTGLRDGPPRGWYCWVYPEDDATFESWMKEHCPTTDCVHRFNSGDPMYTVHITDDQEAILFMLRWL